MIGEFINPGRVVTGSRDGGCVANEKTESQGFMVLGLGTLAVWRRESLKSRDLGTWA